MSMTPEQEKISLKLYDDVCNLIKNYLEAMAREVITGKGVKLESLRKSAISAKVIMGTVYTSMIQSICRNVGEELKEPELGERLLVDILGESLDDYMSSVLPMILKDRLASMVIIRAMSSRLGEVKNRTSEIERLNKKLKDLDPSGTFADIMESINGQKSH